MKLSTIISEKAHITQGANPAEVAYLQEAADLIMHHLGLDDQNVTISIDPPSNIKIDTAHGVTIGFGKKPHKIFMMIDKNLSTGEKLLTLAHEMIHVQQLATGKLILLHVGNNEVRGEWEGKPFDTARYSRNNPWEIEAHSKDKQLQQWVIDQIGNYIPDDQAANNL